MSKPPISRVPMRRVRGRYVREATPSVSVPEEDIRSLIKTALELKQAVETLTRRVRRLEELQGVS